MEAGDPNQGWDQLIVQPKLQSTALKMHQPSFFPLVASGGSLLSWLEHCLMNCFYYITFDRNWLNG